MLLKYWSFYIEVSFDKWYRNGKEKSIFWECLQPDPAYLKAVKVAKRPIVLEDATSILNPVDYTPFLSQFKVLAT